jgi:ABC-2 type transport system permease protein
LTATVPAAGAPVRPKGATAGNPLAGTGLLIRFNLRRDRVRLPVWVLALTLGTVSSVFDFERSYSSAADRRSIAEAMSSPAARAMSGPAHYLSDYTYGSMTGHQLLGFMTVLVAIMSVLTVTRHTRTEEETYRAELVRSTVVGRHAYLTAALSVAVIANTVLALLLWFSLAGLGMESVTSGGSLLYGAANAAVGIVFAAVTAVTAQITAHSRGASGTAFAVLGLAYVLRALGDVGNNWVAWLSPIGWAQRTYVYLDNRWWPLLLAVASTVILACAGYLLSTHRDFGSGLRASRLGRAAASAWLTTPFGFALRLHRGMLTGFGAGLLGLGVMYGSVFGDVVTMFENVEALQDMIEDIGGATFVESFASMLMIVLAVVAMIYTVLAVLRLRAEETSGRAEPLLATSLSRGRWAGSHVAVAALGGTVLLLLAGLAVGGTGAASTGDTGLLPRLVGGALVYAPALWVAVGIAVALFGWVPRATAAAWTLPVLAFVADYLGEILKLPHWLREVSVLGHVPKYPAEAFSWTPLLVLAVLAAALVAFGLEGFRRRDLQTK